MRVKSIWAENFKSFGKKQEIPLSGLTLLIGPNNAGKTNALEILTRLWAFAAEARNQRSAWRTYARSPDLLTRLGATFETEAGAGAYGVVFSDKAHDEVFSSPGLSFTVTAGILTTSGQPSNVSGSSGLQSVLEQSPHPKALWSLLSSYKVWGATPVHLDAASPVQRVVQLGSRGENAAALLDHLRDRYPDSYTALQADLRSCAPEIDRVIAEASDSPGNKEVYFHERGGAALRSAQVSEGLKILLFVLLLLHSPEPPRLLAIEDIERGVHPHRLRDILAFLRKLAERKGVQVVVTSHSPYVVDHFYDMPNEVVVLERDEAGETVCTPLPARLSALPKWRDGALGDLWFSGLIGGVPKR